MHRLVRLRQIALRRLARPKEREERMAQLQLYQLRYRQLVVAQQEAALERIDEVLLAVTREVHEVRGLELRDDRLEGGAHEGLVGDLVVLEHAGYDLGFLLCALKMGGGAGDAWLGDEQYLRSRRR